jgi:hypothetical protein
MKAVWVDGEAVLEVGLLLYTVRNGTPSCPPSHSLRGRSFRRKFRRRRLRMRILRSRILRMMILRMMILGRSLDRKASPFGR